MSDEIHMESAWRHRDMTLREQWHGPQPDEALMAAEDLTGYLDLPARVALMDRLMVYLFASGALECWESVALRAHAVMVHCAPHLLVGRSRGEIPRLVVTVGSRESAEGLRAATELVRSEKKGAAVLARLIDFIFPGTGRQWLFRGTQRAYLLARTWQPWLVSQDGKELSYEDLARIFEGDALATPKARNKARSRWSARAQEVLRKPIEQAGGTVRLQFGKSAGARAKMQQSAKGNQNRLGGGR